MLLICSEKYFQDLCTIKRLILPSLNENFWHLKNWRCTEFPLLREEAVGLYLPPMTWLRRPLLRFQSMYFSYSVFLVAWAQKGLASKYLCGLKCANHPLSSRRLRSMDHLDLIVFTLGIGVGPRQSLAQHHALTIVCPSMVDDLSTHKSAKRFYI